MMGVESREELDGFFDTNEFACSAVWTPSYGTPVTIEGIFDNEFEGVDSGLEVIVQSRAPQLMCASYKIGELKEQEHLEITCPALDMTAEHFGVVAIEPDGTGVTTIKLEKLHPEQMTPGS